MDCAASGGSLAPMVRSRIGSHVAHEDAAETDALPGISRRAPSLALAPWHDVAALGAAEEVARRRTERARARERELPSPFAFVLEIALPWIGRTARTVALGAIMALGGCGPGQRVEIDGVVRDGRTGEPIAGAHITTEDGRTLETDDAGRFSVGAFAGERVAASARDRCEASTLVDGRDEPLTLRLFERLDLDRDVTGALDAEVRIEVRARCDEELPIEWRQIGGPALAADRVRVEDSGRALIVRTHSVEELVELHRADPSARGPYRFEARLPGIDREVRLHAGGVLPERPRSQRARSPRAWLEVAHASIDAIGEGERDAGASDSTCGACHASEGDLSGAAARCEGCHQEPASEWARASMRAPPSSVGAAERVTYHDRGALARQQHDPSSARAEPIACVTCHDPHGSTSPRGLRVFDRVESIAGAPAEHLGSGAICASCHGEAERSTSDRATHAPQAAVLLGRGARTLPAMEGGEHRFLVDTCVRCHMTRSSDGLAGGHTFATDAEHEESATCAPCHGSGVRAQSIGARDWDGDGRSGGVPGEHARAMERASERLRARVAELAIRDACGHVAADVAERGARLALVDARGVVLGDCDENGAIASGEAMISSSVLPARIADAAHDLAMLRRDGSLGVHNPGYAFGVLAAAAHALR